MRMTLLNPRRCSSHANGRSIWPAAAAERNAYGDFFEPVISAAIVVVMYGTCERTAYGKSVSATELLRLPINSDTLSFSTRRRASVSAVAGVF